MQLDVDETCLELGEGFFRILRGQRNHSKGYRIEHPDQPLERVHHLFFEGVNVLPAGDYIVPPLAEIFSTRRLFSVVDEVPDYFARQRVPLQFAHRPLVAEQRLELSAPLRGCIRPPRFLNGKPAFCRGIGAFYCIFRADCGAVAAGGTELRPHYLRSIAPNLQDIRRTGTYAFAADGTSIFIYRDIHTGLLLPLSLPQIGSAVSIPRTARLSRPTLWGRSF